ncbi:MAG TPA: protein kinase [Candidatus Desulfaltia sp.]|nr:protein kinase [Candidatus Desulfaltia sp.]
MNLRCPECHADNSEDSRFCRRCATPLLHPVPPELAGAPTLIYSSPLPELTPGTTFAGRYLVIEELGKGGMGKVYKVLDQEINERVSLKLIKPEIAADRETIERFQNEIKIARRITHKNICRMYHLGREKDTFYITMEYIQGENLKKMIKMTKGMSLGTALSIAQQVCQGLAEAHRLGIVHRDLKPQNIMLDEDGGVRVMDFGIASSVETKGATLPGMMIGTPEYMSPEQIDGGQVDARSDIYSLGIILYEMLTGKTPFSGDTPWSVVLKQKNDAPHDPREINPEIPESMSRVILRCLEKQKEKRYQSAEELLAELQNIKEEHSQVETRLRTKQVSGARRPFLRIPAKKAAGWAVAAVFLILIVMTAVKMIFQKPAPVAAEDMLKMALISFENQTGDPSFDYLQDAIPNLLITSLEQSDLFRITSWERLRDLQKQLGKGDQRVIDSDLGIELCRMDGVQAIIRGSFMKAGDTFVTDVKVLDVETKGLLKTVSARGEGVDSILKRQIDDLSREISKGFGQEELVTRVKTTPIAEVTTNSLEAYNYFLRGREDYEKFYFEDARRYLERAVELDPDFAMAYSYLARVYSSLGNSPAVERAVHKLEKIGGKVSGKEGLYIKALLATGDKGKNENYVDILRKIIAEYPEEKRARLDLAARLNFTGKLEEAAKELDLLLKLDPKFGPALNMIAYVCGNQKKYDLAIKHFKEYAAVSPGDSNPYDSMGELYFDMGKFDESVEKFKEAIRIKPDFGSDNKISYIFALREEYAGALSWIDQFIAAAPSNGMKSWGCQLKALYDHLLGKTGAALVDLERAKEYALADNDFNNADNLYRSLIWTFCDLGRYEQFIQTAKERFDFRAKRQLRSGPLNEIILTFYQGLADIRQNRPDAAKAKLAKIDALRPKVVDPEKPTLEMAYNHLLSEVLAAQGEPEKAIDAYKKIGGPAINIGGIGTLIMHGVPYILDIPARAYLKKGQLDKAIVEYEKLISPDPVARKYELIHPLSRFRLAKLYEKKGESAKALEQYNKLTLIWKDADPDFAEAQEIKSRLAALRAD